MRQHLQRNIPLNAGRARAPFDSAPVSRRARALSAHPQSKRFAYNQSEAKLICHFAAIAIAFVVAVAVVFPGFNLANGIAHPFNY